MCEPTIRGEIKKARAGNYELTSAIFEFIDNAIDAKADRIRIDIREKSSSGIPHKFIISDNATSGISCDTMKHIFSWTYERHRSSQEVGEYGTGFKTAAVNIADKLTLLSRHGDTSYQAIADWQDMADENRWSPIIMEISNDYFADVHPFHRGSTFVLEGLRYEALPCTTIHSIETSSLSMVMQLFRKLWDEIAYHYRYLLRSSPHVGISLKGVMNPGDEISDMDIREHDLFRKQIDPFWKGSTVPSSEDKSHILTSTIAIYQDSLQFYRIFFQSHHTKKWETVEFIEKRKNGNSVLKCHDISPSLFSSMRLIDQLTFQSVHIMDSFRSQQCMSLYPTCTLDIVRHGRVMGRDLAIRSPRAEPFTFFVKHEVWYQSYVLNHLLGIQYNKQNHGVLRDNELRYTFEYLQQLHEREFHKSEKLYHQQKKQEMQESCSSSATSTTTPQEEGHTHESLRSGVAFMNHEGILDLSSLDVATPMPPPPSSQPKRKHFAPSTKMQILHRQECRDPVLDFVLKEPILLTEYDHKNGQACMNSKDNCQALSVLCHSLKTRFPEIFQMMESNEGIKTQFIVDLLNCLTRSKYFIDGWIKGEIQVKSLQQQLSVVQEGLFYKLDQDFS